MKKNNRTFSNTLQQPKQQLKISIFLSAIVSLMFCAFVLINLNILHASIIDLATENQIAPAAIDNINRLFGVMTVVTIAFGIAAIGIGFLLGFTMTTRMFGPVVPIRRLVASFIEGDYKARSYLRKHDEFQDLMQDLNTLGGKLEERHGSKA